MKHFTKQAWILIGIVSISAGFASCHQESIDTRNEVTVVANDPEAIVDFMNLKVKKPSGVSKQLLDAKNGEELLNFFNQKYGGNPQARVASLNENIPKDVFYKTLETIIVRYPQLNVQDYSDQALTRIYEDFPSLTNEDSVKLYSHEVATYYERLITNEFQAELVEVREKFKGAREAFGYSSNNAYVSQLASQYSVYAYHINLAAGDALNWTGEYFGDPLLQGNRADSFRHCVWNAESCRKMFMIGFNKWEVLMRVREFATAHEYVTNNGPWYLPVTDAGIMDLHNNCYGRTYMKNTTSTNLVDRATNVPSQDRIKSEFLYHVNNTNYIKIGNAAYILGLGAGGDINALANANYFGYDYAAALTF
ncbi:hypothetical protein A6C57_27870 (plasmid) [Fibrella sp. ES10-3-2-2]